MDWRNYTQILRPLIYYSCWTDWQQNLCSH